MLSLTTRYADRGAHEWGALFYTVLQNRIYDWHRRHRVRRRWLTWLDSGENNREEDPLERIADPGAIDPADRHATHRTLTALESALASLPARQREAFLLRVWEGLDVAETARAMKCSAGSVKTHYSRAVHTLREQLGEQWP